MSKVSKGEGDKDCKLFDIISHSGSSNTTPTQCFCEGMYNMLRMLCCALRANCCVRYMLVGVVS